MPEPTVCRHCGVRIVYSRYALGSKWMHDEVGQSRPGDYYWVCKANTVAGPA